MTWQQIYDPMGSMVLSTFLAAIPVVVMLAALGFFHIKAHIAAGMGLIAALVVAIFAYGMPAEMAGRAALPHPVFVHGLERAYRPFRRIIKGQTGSGQFLARGHDIRAPQKGGQHWHGFIGMEREAVDQIAGWIKAPAN